MEKGLTSNMSEKRVVSPLIVKTHRNVSAIAVKFTGLSVSSTRFSLKKISIKKKELLRILKNTVTKYEGELLSFNNNEIMIVFGISIVHEDDTERAVYAALDITGVLERFNEENETNVSFCIGIDSGIVSVRRLDSKKKGSYKITGKTVTNAKRLAKIASNEILVNEIVYKKSKYLFEFEIFDQQGRINKTKSFVPYRVLGMKEVPGRKRASFELHSPLIGRDKEFRMVNKVLSNVMKGKSEVLSIKGEAGIGKSRLIDELKRVAKNNVNWLSGRCPSYGKGFPFWVFLEQIRSYLGVQDSNPECEPESIVSKRGEFVFKERMKEYLPYLCLFLSIKVLEHLQEKVMYLDAKSIRLQEFVSVKALFREIARDKPLVLYFEDMHWIDPESQELLKFLLEGLKNEPVLFLIETRPAEGTGFYKIEKGIKKKIGKRYKEIYLKKLSIENAKKLIKSLLKTSEPIQEVSSLILEKSEGNPLYIEEIIRSLIELGVLKEKKKKWRLTKNVSSFKVPDTIDTIIRSRIERLPIDVQEVLGQASVIGKNFLRKVLFSISGKKDLQDNLNLLEEREFIQKKDTSHSITQFSTDAEYQFRHILIKDVVYSKLRKTKRKEIHKKIAMTMEDFSKEKIDDYFELIAYHYYNAEIIDKAYDYYRMAGDRARKLYNNNVSIECYKKAIELHRKLFSEKGEDLAELYEEMGDVEEVKAKYDNAIQDYKTAFGYYKNIEKKARLMSKIGQILRQKGEIDDAISTYKRVTQMLKDSPDSVVLSEMLINYAFVLADGKNDFKKARSVIEKALKKLDKRKERRIFARGLTTLGNTFLLENDYDKALEHHEKALRIYEQLEDKKGIVITSNNIGNLYNDKGEFDTALEYYERGLSTSQYIGYKNGIGVLSGNIGTVFWKKGKFDTALEYCKVYLSVSEETGDRMGIGRASSKIGTIYFDKGQLETALGFYKKYLLISEEVGDKLGIGIALSDIGSIFHNKGEFDKALSYYKKYLNLTRKIGYKPGIGVAHCNLGILYYDKGKFDTAKKYLKKAEKILLDVKDSLNLLQVYVSLSELHTAKGNLASAIKFSEKALSLVKKTGAREKEVIALRALGKALSKKDFVKAIFYLEQSVSIAEELKMPLDIAQSSFELAKILKDAGKAKEAKKYIGSARKIFKETGAYGWLEKLREKKK